MRGFEDIGSKGHFSAKKGVFGSKNPLFGFKMEFWAYIFETAHQILMIFGQMLDTIALNDLALVLCTKKI